MSRLRALYRRLDRGQRSRWFRIVATVLVLAVTGATFGSLIVRSYALDVQRQALLQALTGQSLADGDPYALSLRETGTVTVNGRTYGGERFRDSPQYIFDETGEISVPAALAEALIADQIPEWAPRWLMERPGTTWMLTALLTGWLLLIIWMEITLPFLLTAIGTAIPVGIAWWFGNDQAMWAFGGIGLLTFTYVLLSRTAMLVLDPSRPVAAVAHTVLKEASRTRLSLVFVLIILVMLPLLPLGLDAESPLRFRIQTFISRSMGFTFYLAACMTLFLSCATVAFDIRDRQIWQTVTKPVSRLSYLLGKWVGVVTVNLIIMGIAAVSIFTFVQYLREQPVAAGMVGYEDAQQVRDAVLTARVGSAPRYERLTAEQVRERVAEAIARDEDLARMEEVPAATRAALQEEIENAYQIGQRTVPPLATRSFRFEGLGAARESGSMLTLRYRFHIMRDDEHETFHALFYFNDDPNLAVRRTYVPTLSHVLSIPPELVRDDGSLTVSIVNLYEPPSHRRGAGALNFEAKDFELLHKVGTFEANFFRAVVIDWVKLAFLAMLGITCATFLSFPVACMTSFTIFVAGTIGPYLAMSLQEYYAVPLESVDFGDVGMVMRWAFRGFIRSVAYGIVFLLQAFGEYRPTQLLVEGRLIAWSAVVSGVVKVGLLWSGITLAIGYAAMRKRQLAIYSGHG